MRPRQPPTRAWSGLLEVPVDFAAAPADVDRARGLLGTADRGCAGGRRRLRLGPVAAGGRTGAAARGRAAGRQLVRRAEVHLTRRLVVGRQHLLLEGAILLDHAAALLDRLPPLGLELVEQAARVI